jgi:hypothetical protein
MVKNKKLTRKDLTEEKKIEYDNVVSFLKSKRLYSAFQRNTEVDANKHPWKPLIEVVKDKTPWLHLAISFDWDKSLEGMDFWADLDTEWCNQ